MWRNGVPSKAIPDTTFSHIVFIAVPFGPEHESSSRDVEEKENDFNADAEDCLYRGTGERIAVAMVEDDREGRESESEKGGNDCEASQPGIST